jgi:hypothetical protein
VPDRLYAAYQAARAIALEATADTVEAAVKEEGDALRALVECEPRTAEDIVRKVAALIDWHDGDCVLGEHTRQIREEARRFGI